MSVSTNLPAWPSTCSAALSDVANTSTNPPLTTAASAVTPWLVAILPWIVNWSVVATWAVPFHISKVLRFGPPVTVCGTPGSPT